MRQAAAIVCTALGLVPSMTAAQVASSEDIENAQLVLQWPFDPLTYATEFEGDCELNVEDLWLGSIVTQSIGKIEPRKSFLSEDHKVIRFVAREEGGIIDDVLGDTPQIEFTGEPAMISDLDIEDFPELYEAALIGLSFVCSQ